MTIIRTQARLFEHLLPLISQQEAKGHKYIRDEDDGIVGRVGINATCVKRVYFDDGSQKVIFEDRTKELFPDG